MLDAVRLTSGPRRGNVSASTIESLLDAGKIPVGAALVRAIDEGYVRRVLVFRCRDCGTDDPKHGLGPAHCRYCGRVTLRDDFALYQATPSLLARSPSSSHRPSSTEGLVLDRLTAADRVVPLDADPGGANTAARATAFSTAQTARDRVPRVSLWVAIVGVVVAIAGAVAAWIGLRQPGVPPAAAPIPAATVSSPRAGLAPAVLYVSEAEARARCGAQQVVFVTVRSRIWHPKGDSYYGIWNHAPFPAKGYGCADDLDRAGYRKSRSR